MFIPRRGQLATRMALIPAYPGNELLYLTTQDVGMDEGRPGLMTSPVQELQEDFPLRPNLLSNLIPFNYNLWLGKRSAADML